MAYIAEPNHEEKILYITASGDITLEDSQAAMANWSRIEEPVSFYDVIIDFRQVTKAPPITNVHDIVNSLKAIKESLHGRIALIVPQNEVTKASMACMLVRPFNIRMEAYGDVESAKQYFKTDNPWIK